MLPYFIIDDEKIPLLVLNSNIWAARLISGWLLTLLYSIRARSGSCASFLTTMSSSVFEEVGVTGDISLSHELAGLQEPMTGTGQWAVQHTVLVGHICC